MFINQAILINNMRMDRDEEKCLQAELRMLFSLQFFYIGFEDSFKLNFLQREFGAIL